MDSNDKELELLLLLATSRRKRRKRKMCIPPIFTGKEAAGSISQLGDFII